MKRTRVLLLSCALLAAVAATAAEKSQTIVYINGAKYYIHTVQKGETLYALSKLYGVGEPVILASNPEMTDGLKADANIKIPVVGDVKPPKAEKKLKKTFDSHYVAAGETLYGISRRYEISVDTILEDNPDLDPLHLSIGQRILIRKSEKGESSAARNISELEEYKDNLNSVSQGDGYSYHLVHAGETLYALSHRFDVSEEEIIRINGLTDGLKTGTIIRLPAAKSAVSSGRDDSDDRKQRPTTKFSGSGEEVSFRALSPDETLDVALLLPLSAAGGANRNFYVEFYEGFLLGLEDVKAKGYSVDLTLFDTSHDYNKTAETVSDPRFRRAKLIVGPVYEDELLPVLQFAESNAVPVVSPLANISATGSSVLFQMAPDHERKHDKLAELFAEGKHVTLIYTDSTDKDFESEVLGMLGGRAYSTYNYTYVHHRTAARTNSDPSDLTQLLQNGQDNVFVVMSNNETDVDRILAAIASANAGLVSRGHTAPKFVVIGNPKWHRYNTIDRSIFFKDRVVMVSTYHAKRDSEAIRRFDSRFAEAFGALPSLYAYRGYDAAVIFCSGMFSDIEYDMEGRRYRPLQTVYNFKRSESGNRVNSEWMRVDYNGDFTIKAE